MDTSFSADMSIRDSLVIGISILGVFIWSSILILATRRSKYWTEHKLRRLVVLWTSWSAVVAYALQAILSYGLVGDTPEAQHNLMELSRVVAQVERSILLILGLAILAAYFPEERHEEAK